MMRQLRLWFAAVAAFGGFTLTPSTSLGQPVLYGATGSQSVGHLYILNQSNGSVITDVGPLMDGVGNSYSLTGLAFNPASGILYGSTSNNSATAPRSLVSINRANAQVTLIGPFSVVDGGTLSDIAFQPGTGTLFGWSPQSSALERVNLATGATTQIGPSINGLQGGGSLAFNSSGTLYAAPDALNTNTLRTVNPATGAQTVVATITGAGLDFINAMKFNGTTLYANLSPGPSSPSSLGTVDVVTGVVTYLGQNVIGMDAIEFATPVPEPTSLALAGTGFVAALALIRRRKRALATA